MRGYNVNVFTYNPRVNDKKDHVPFYDLPNYPFPNDSICLICGFPNNEGVHGFFVWVSDPIFT
jgi:hypothetical protein